jgi:hypothetical protein
MSQLPQFPMIKPLFMMSRFGTASNHEEISPSRGEQTLQKASNTPANQHQG